MAQYIDLVQKKSNINYEETYIKQNLPREWLFKLDKDMWTGNGPYTQNVTITHMRPATTGIIGVAQKDSEDVATTSEQWKAANYAELRITDQQQNRITVTAYGVKPTIDIPCVISCSSNMKLYRPTGSYGSDTVVGE